MRKLLVTTILLFSTSAFAQLRKGPTVQESTGMHPVQYVGGGVVGTFIGFGLGHVLQGRWLERGWIFTVAEPPLAVLGAAALLSNSAHTGKSGNNGLAIFGAAFVGMRIWEAVDLWYTPYANSQRARRPASEFGFMPQPDGGGQLIYSYNF